MPILNRDRYLMDRVRKALLDRFAGTLDATGRVASLEHNLLPGVHPMQFAVDLARVDAVDAAADLHYAHSSSALLVNTFAPFKDSPDDLWLLEERGVSAITFERQLPLVSGRRPANLDLWLERPTGLIGIESKLLETFARHRPRFADAYLDMAPPVSDAAWWSAFEHFRDEAPTYLDTARLIKHYFGMNLIAASREDPRPMTLLYLFWEPDNWREVDACNEHREELEIFEHLVAGSSVAFRWMSYPDLWDRWRREPSLRIHAERLMHRYCFAI